MSFVLSGVVISIKLISRSDADSFVPYIPTAFPSTTLMLWMTESVPVSHAGASRIMRLLSDRSFSSCMYRSSDAGSLVNRRVVSWKVAAWMFVNLLL